MGVNTITENKADKESGIYWVGRGGGHLKDWEKKASLRRLHGVRWGGIH